MDCSQNLNSSTFDYRIGRFDTTAQCPIGGKSQDLQGFLRNTAHFGTIRKIFIPSLNASQSLWTIQKMKKSVWSTRKKFSVSKVLYSLVSMNLCGWRNSH